VIHALAPFVYDAREEVWNAALHGDIDHQGQRCGGAGFHEYGIGRRGVFEDFHCPFVDFLEGIFVGYGSKGYNTPVWSNGRVTSFPSSGLLAYTDVGN